MNQFPDKLDTVNDVIDAAEEEIDGFELTTSTTREIGDKEIYKKQRQKEFEFNRSD